MKGEGLDGSAGGLTDKGEISDGYHTFNELYEHRHALFAVACHFLGGWKSKEHHDGTMFAGWFIAGLTTSEGMATYHLPIRLWDAFPGRVRERAPEWDGHTANDVIGRLWTHVAALQGRAASAAGRPDPSPPAPSAASGQVAGCMRCGERYINPANHTCAPHPQNNGEAP